MHSIQERRFMFRLNSFEFKQVPTIYTLKLCLCLQVLDTSAHKPLQIVSDFGPANWWSFFFLFLPPCIYFTTASTPLPK
jgi:hypothetical protein